MMIFPTKETPYTLEVQEKQRYDVVCINVIKVMSLEILSRYIYVYTYINIGLFKTLSLLSVCVSVVTRVA